MKKVVLTAISILIFIFLIMPIVEAAAEREDYYVTILSGDGIIKTSKDEFAHGIDTRAPYVDCQKDGFEDVDSINVKVRENENIKNKIDYDKTITFYFWDRYVTVNPWDNVGYITDTRMVDVILENGIDTRAYNPKASFGNLVYSESCRKIYLFVPPENMKFSHFVDQDGNKFSIEDAVTKNLVLTPIYVEDEVETIFMNKKVHNVTFLKGEGEIASEKGYKDKIIFQTYDGEASFYEISQRYANHKYSDYEKGIIALEERKKIGLIRS